MIQRNRSVNWRELSEVKINATEQRKEQKKYEKEMRTV